MENNSKLLHYKEQVDSLVINVFNDYLKLETDSQKTIKSLTDQVDSLKDDYNSMLKSIKDEHDSKIDLLQSNLDTAKHGNVTKDKLISELQQKVNSVTEETSENKFDIIRGQAKEIAAKDKEIIRLREEVVNVKEGCMEKKHTGWSPTSSSTPTPPVEEVKLDKDTTLNGPESDSESDEEYELITYRKTTYYLNKDKVYEIVKDEDGDDDVGDCMGDWIKQTSGKFKLIKH
jgi:Skp family chaperone for outer membrane proteins